MEDRKLTMERITDLLNILGYEVSASEDEVTGSMDILRNGSLSGKITSEEKDLFTIKSKGKQVENLNLYRMKVKEGTLRDIYHVEIDDDYLKVDSYNVMVQRGLDSDINYVKISDDDFSLRSYVYGLSLTLKDSNKKLFIYNEGDTIIIRDLSMKRDLYVNDEIEEDQVAIEDIKDEVYETTGFDIVTAAIIHYTGKYKAKKNLLIP